MRSAGVPPDLRDVQRWKATTCFDPGKNSRAREYNRRNEEDNADERQSSDNDQTSVDVRFHVFFPPVSFPGSRRGTPSSTGRAYTPFASGHAGRSPIRFALGRVDPPRLGIPVPVPTDEKSTSPYKRFLSNLSTRRGGSIRFAPGEMLQPTGDCAVSAGQGSSPRKRPVSMLADMSR